MLDFQCKLIEQIRQFTLIMKCFFDITFHVSLSNFKISFQVEGLNVSTLIQLPLKRAANVSIYCKYLIGIVGAFSF